MPRSWGYRECRQAAGAAPHSGCVGGKRDLVQLRCYSELCQTPGRRRSPLRSLRRVGTGGWTPPGSPRRSRPARCVQMDSNRGLSGAPSRAGGRRLGLPLVTSQPERRGPRGDARDAGPQLRSRAAAEACTPVPRSALRTSPGSASKIPNQGKKEKARGRGRCGLRRPPSPPVGRQQRCYWLRGATRGKWGGGPGSPPGLALTALQASSGGGCCAAEGDEGGGSPRGARPPGAGGCYSAPLRALPAF